MHLGGGETAGAQRHRRHAGLLRGLDVPRRVADEDALRAACLLQRDLEDVGFGLAVVGVVGGGDGVEVVARQPDLLERGVSELLLAAARERHLVALAARGAHCVGGAVESAHLGQELLVLLLPRVAQVAAVLALDVVADEARDELVAAHADRAVHAPQRRVQVEASERARPRDGVVVRRVDEGAVDVEQDGVDGPGGLLRIVSHPTILARSRHPTQ